MGSFEGVELPADESAVILVDGREVRGLVEQDPDRPQDGPIHLSEEPSGPFRVLESTPLGGGDSGILQLLEDSGIAVLDALGPGHRGKTRGVNPEREQDRFAQHPVISVERIDVEVATEVADVQEPARSGVGVEGVELAPSGRTLAGRDAGSGPGVLPVTDPGRVHVRPSTRPPYLRGFPTGPFLDPNRSRFRPPTPLPTAVQIIEVFHSLQGEGPLTGVRTTFIRTARCNLRCSWCDTPYSFGPGKSRSIDSLLSEVGRHRTRHVCLTGGEPLLQGESVTLVERLAGRGISTVIETGGSLDISPYLKVPRVALSVDVKCPSSKMQGRNRWTNIPKLRSRDILKFVIADRKDYLYARRIVRRYRGPATLVFQPVWGSDAGRLADWVLGDRLDVRVMLQEHKVLWGDVPGR